MPRLRGFPRPKIDQAELELAQARVDARLVQFLWPSSDVVTEAVQDPPLTSDLDEVAEETAGQADPAAAGSDDSFPDAAPAWTPLVPGPAKRSRPPIRVVGQSGPVGAFAEPWMDEPQPLFDAPIELPGAFEAPGELALAAYEAPVELSLAAVDAPAELPGAFGALDDLPLAAFEAPPELPVAAVEAPAELPVAAYEAPVELSLAAFEAPAELPNNGRSAKRARAANAVRLDPGGPVVAAVCPYCALLLDPAPASSRRCPRCRQRIMVKRINGRTVYLTEAALDVFEEERRRSRGHAQLTRDRDRWLLLAAKAGAPAQRVERLAATRLSEDLVLAARRLYSTTVNQSFAAAKRSHDWEAMARIRRRDATDQYRIAGSPMPPPADIVALYREGVASELRGIAEISRDAELTSASCCDACRRDDRSIVRISKELRDPLLPHAGCPKGLCRCRWDLAERDRSTIRRYLRRRAGDEPPVARVSEGEPAG